MKSRSQAREIMLARDRTPALKAVTPEIALAEEDRRDIMEQIRERLYQYAGNLRDARGLSDETGVSLSAIYAIRRGATRWPRWTTIFRLLKSLDLQLTLVDSFPRHLADEVAPRSNVTALKPPPSYYKHGH